MTPFGQALRQAREFRGLTQEELGGASEATQNNISRMERGRAVKSSTIQKMADALEVDFICCDEGWDFVSRWMEAPRTRAMVYRGPREVEG